MSHTVIIPAYKAQDFIARCLDSIKTQTLPPTEVLIGVDACPETLTAIQSYLLANPSFPRTAVFYFPAHAGCYKIRNSLALAASTSTLVLFDADDEMLPHYCASLISILEPGSLARSMMYIPSTKKSQPAVSHIAIHKQDFIDLSGFEPWGCAADTEFYQRAMQADYQDRIVEAPNMVYHIHETNLTVAADTGWRSPMRMACHREIERRQTAPVQRQIPATADYVIHHQGDPVPSAPTAPTIILLGFGVDDDLAERYTAADIKHICGDGELWTISDWWWRYPHLTPDRACQIHVNLPDVPFPGQPDRWQDWRSRYDGIGPRAILGAPDPRIPRATVHDMQFLHDTYGHDLTTSSMSCSMLIALHHYSTRVIKLFGVPLSMRGAYQHQADGLLKTCELCERNNIKVVWPERDFIAADSANLPPPKFTKPYWLIGT
jgi:glycosyltransferase involved in cell wall biosynthesis